MEKLAYSVPELAEALGIGRNVAYELVQRPGFPTIRIGKRIVVSVEGLKAWLERQAHEGQAG